MSLSSQPPVDLRTLTRETESAARKVPPPSFSWKTRILIPGAILLTLLVLIGYTAQDSLLPARAVQVVPVVVRASAEGGAVATVQAPGWVEADPFPIAVSALADGVVKEVLALEGQTIKAGQVVARLVDDDAKLALARAEAELAEKQARLEAAQRNWDNPVERTRALATSEAMVAESRADLDKLGAEIAAEEAKLASLQFEAQRAADAFKQQAASEIETVRAQKEFESQKAVVQATKARRPVLEAQLAQRTAELTAAKDNLRLRIEETQALAETKAQRALAQAARDEAALRLSRMDVRSPADGVVMQRLTASGNKLVMNMDDPHSAHAVLLYDPQKLQVRTDIPLADAAKVGVGTDAKIVVAVLPDRAFNGRITRIVNEADIQKNTLQVKVAILDPDPQLKPEMLARVRFSTNGSTTRPTSGQTVFVPMELIHRTGDTAMAWVVDPRRNVAVHRTIQLGQTQQDGWIAVVAGLAPGDQLIADNAGLSDGQRIRVTGEASVNSPKTETGNPHAAH
jgi:RND family efflux transporter MFP subunit